MKDVPFNFDSSCLNAFCMLKETLILALILKTLDWDLRFEIMCDASDHIVGAVLGQRNDKKVHSIYHVSKTLDGA